jgi:toxin ParE1/3/4
MGAAKSGLMDVIWAEATERDIDDIFAHYSEIDHSLPMRLISEIEASVQPLTDFPLLGPAIGYNGLRKWRAGKTPFVLFYDVTPQAIIIQHVRNVASDWRAIFG